MLETKNLSVAYGKQTIIANLSVSIPKGKITALVGPNGCGKSTLLKTLVRINKAKSGEVLLEGKHCLVMAIWLSLAHYPCCRKFW